MTKNDMYNCFSFDARVVGHNDDLTGFAYGNYNDPACDIWVYVPDHYSIGSFGKLRCINGKWSFEKEV